MPFKLKLNQTFFNPPVPVHTIIRIELYGLNLELHLLIISSKLMFSSRKEIEIKGIASIFSRPLSCKQANTNLNNTKL